MNLKSLWQTLGLSGFLGLQLLLITCGGPKPQSTPPTPPWPTGGTVTTGAPSPTQIPTQAPTPPAPAVRLMANPAVIERGGVSTLAWSSLGATELIIAPGIGIVEPQGTASVTPAETTRYTIRAEGPGGMATASVRIVVTAPRPREAAAAPPPEPMPQFPWPPPKWTSRYPVPDGLVMRTGNPETLGTAFDRIKEALRRADMSEWSVYVIGDDGFAVVTRLESIEVDGRPKPDRWSVDQRPLEKFSLQAYLAALFRAQPGRYRVVVLTVTARPVIAGPAPPTPTQIEKLLKSGAGDLPLEIRRQNLGPSQHCEALIYEFYRASADDPPTLVEMSALSPVQHLVGAGLWRKEEL